MCSLKLVCVPCGSTFLIILGGFLPNLMLPSTYLRCNQVKYLAARNPVFSVVKQFINKVSKINVDHDIFEDAYLHDLLSENLKIKRRQRRQHHQRCQRRRRRQCCQRCQ